jgi:asparagine synthase (glutamine-hydrolysing)
MSVIFGLRHPLGMSIQQHELQTLASATTRYSRDGTFLQSQAHIGMGFQAYHTHARSKLETQPFCDDSGNMVALDGRLDNWQELRDNLNFANRDVTDSEIILRSFLKWGPASFSKLVGDWAFSLWSAATHALYLARDHAGTRTLYFSNSGGSLLWSTYLESFFTEGTRHTVDERYAARFLSMQPIGNLTPYHGIRAVPPAHYLTFDQNAAHKNHHWNCIADTQIRYKADADYEEHFFSLFAQSVARRTGAGAPILAQLSGGMDSTSIVCMSDYLRGSEGRYVELLDTLSFYNDTEPYWNEKPYFSIVEARRGKVGLHFDTSLVTRTFEPSCPPLGKYLLPGADSGTEEHERNLHDQMASNNYRAILSGIGGDDLLGGVPSPLPELADHLVSLKLERLLKCAMSWCLTDRTSLVHTLWATMRFTFGLYHRYRVDTKKRPPWITPQLWNFVTDESALARVVAKWSEASPSAISNGFTWWSIMETLPHQNPSTIERREYRYPYLDRDLVDFLLRIPSEQLVRPGRRRSLMRRALKGIVPPEVLERRRKAFISRGPLVSLQCNRHKIDHLFVDSHAVARNFVDPGHFRTICDLEANGKDSQWLMAILRTVQFELWLRATFPACSQP